MKPTIEQQLHIYFSEIYSNQPAASDQATTSTPSVELIAVNDERSTMNQRSPFRNNKRMAALALVAASGLIILGLTIGFDRNQITDTSVEPATKSPPEETSTTQAPTSTTTATSTFTTSLPSEPVAGFGVIEFDGTIYEAVFSQCDTTEDSFIAEGIYDGEEGRWTMNLFFEKDSDYDGDGQLDQNARLGLGTNIPDPEFELAEWGSRILEGIDSPDHEFTFERTENMVSGSGQMFDRNGIALPKDESFPFTFSATCTGEQG